MTIRSITHASQLLFLLLTGIGLVGCATSPVGLVARDESGTRSFLIDARTGYFWTDSDGVTDVILLQEGNLVPETAGKPGKPLQPGRESALVHTVHVRVNWKQQARGVGDPDPTNATLNWLVQERIGGRLVTLARYRGAGHARVNVAGSRASVTLKDVSIRAVSSVRGQPDPLDRFQLSGGGTLEQNQAQVERLRGAISDADGLAVNAEPPAGGPPARGLQP